MAMTSKRGGAVTALVRAEHGAGPIRISTSEKKVLDDALRRRESARLERHAAPGAHHTARVVDELEQLHQTTGEILKAVKRR